MAIIQGCEIPEDLYYNVEAYRRKIEGRNLLCIQCAED